ncbi:MAG: M20 family metallopeptidase [Chloroflexi bacterium]|nr:M20 family metallopeptidase [Chloroflexota bacterium]
MEKQDIKSLAVQGIVSRREELAELSRKIHSRPELAFKEVRAAEWLAGYLEASGFTVERGFGGLKTAFRATAGAGSPAIALLAEYDALPGVGHACGHNLIAAIAAGAGAALGPLLAGTGGTVLVIGTPGEEMYGGKALMAERGCFDGVDAAMMVHPGVSNTIGVRSLACQGLKVEFFGRASHAASRPEDGINALEAMIQSFNAVNSLRQHIDEKARIHGIITRGGEAPNVVPAYAAGEFLVRSEQDGYLDELKGRTLDCFIGAATATGARLEYKWGRVRYAAMRNNLTISRLFRDNMRELGREASPPEARMNFGSTDMGNVSRLVPSIHPMIAIAPPGVLVHSPEFAEAAGGEEGLRGLLDGAKALAMTAVDILADPGVVRDIKEEFRRSENPA